MTSGVGTIPYIEEILMKKRQKQWIYDYLQVFLEFLLTFDNHHFGNFIGPGVLSYDLLMIEGK